MVVVIWLSPEVFMRLPRRLSPRRPLTAEGCLDSVPSALLPVLLCLAKGGALRVIWPDSRMPLVVRLNGWGPSPSAASSLCFSCKPAHWSCWKPQVGCFRLCIWMTKTPPTF